MILKYHPSIVCNFYLSILCWARGWFLQRTEHSAVCGVTFKWGRRAGRGKLPELASNCFPLLLNVITKSPFSCNSHYYSHQNFHKYLSALDMEDQPSNVIHSGRQRCKLKDAPVNSSLNWRFLVRSFPLHASAEFCEVK